MYHLKGPTPSSRGAQHWVALGSALWVSASVARAFRPVQLPRNRAAVAAHPTDVTSGAAALADSNHVKAQ